MRYFSLVADRPLVWCLFLVFLLSTAWLAWRGHKKTTDLASYSIGSGDMGPVVIGVTLASSIASTATFVINPGFVYASGLSAFMHLGVAAGLGLVLGLLVLSPGFRRVGAKYRAITLPHWMRSRYESKALGIFFAGLALLSVTFVVLICGGISIVMQTVLGLTNTESLVLTIGFVFSYIMVGGTYAHAYTNTMQGIIMAVVAVVIVFSGFHLLSGGPSAVSAQLAAQDPHLVALVNPASPLFSSYFSVYVSGFVIGFALVCQPHILTKALYVKSDREVRRYLAVTILVSLVFTALLLVGFYARLADVPRAAFTDPVSGLVMQDRVMAAYLAHMFDPVTLAFVTVAVLAAGMSTLDGILVALSSIAANDIYLGLGFAKTLPEEVRHKRAQRVSQLMLVGLAVVAFALALNPPKLLGVFGQIGVYGVIAAGAVPVLVGVWLPAATKRTAFAAALSGAALHFGLYTLGRLNPELGRGWSLANPAVTATIGLLVSAATALPALASHLRNRRSAGNSSKETRLAEAEGTC